ncbi:hypothetical protein QI30_14630 [Kurthia sp. 3B1D]|uniref:Uncharacterized protein n=1 Tax=Candidatus Kurthia intestinigallinarum TaxID=1562256 RepID=A0A433RRE6_9BACL|nr:hypothetical protein [Kurthia sp. 3B1D]RUS53735.1 hypothetical protein QI30_14630 [Kurthia sp. 3B1D]
MSENKPTLQELKDMSIRKLYDVVKKDEQDNYPLLRQFEDKEIAFLKEKVSIDWQYNRIFQPFAIFLTTITVALAAYMKLSDVHLPMGAAFAFLSTTLFATIWLNVFTIERNYCCRKLELMLAYFHYHEQPAPDPKAISLQKIKA